MPSPHVQHEIDERSAPATEVVYETIKQEGFLIVILGRQQLFTENTLTVVLPVLRRRDPLMFANVARLWSTVLAANVAGALLFAWVGARTSIFSPETRPAMSTLGVHAIGAGDRDGVPHRHLRRLADRVDAESGFFFRP